MVFSSLTFLCVFLPAVFLLHCLAPNIYIKNAFLLAGSLLFYAYGEPVCVLLMIGETFCCWLLTHAMERFPSWKKGFLAIGLAADLAALFFFKYAGFLTESINALLPVTLPVPQIRLPIGISFFTFQAMSCLIDVYRGKCAPQKHFPRLLLYISFFPQLIAGPIVKYSGIERELTCRIASAEDISCGIRRFISGLAKKVLIADLAATAADLAFAQNAVLNPASAWLGAAAYMLQIYFDFSGYSDMAIGMGRMFGFHFRENFLDPYQAHSMKEFWRRWHISLSSWFRDYLYIPLGGNRKGRVRTCLNKLLVFLCTGLWHGAGFNFLVWGFYHGLFLLAEEALSTRSRPANAMASAPDTAEDPAAEAAANLQQISYFEKGKASNTLPFTKLLRHACVLLVVLAGFVIFRADSMRQAADVLSAMAGAAPFTAVSMVSLYAMLKPVTLLALAAGMVLCTPAAQKLRTWLQRDTIGSMGISIVLYALCLVMLAGSTYHPFIYFRF